MQEYFYELSDQLFKQLKTNETLLINFRGENSDFTRFNQSQVRQSGLVFQSSLSIELVNGAKHASYTLSLSHDLHEDLKGASSMLATLRSIVDEVPDDPHLLFNTSPISSEDCGEPGAFESKTIINDTCKYAAQLDLVGFLACGKIFQGFTNSLGQKNWFEAGEVDPTVQTKNSFV